VMNSVYAPIRVVHTSSAIEEVVSYDIVQYCAITEAV